MLSYDEAVEKLIAEGKAAGERSGKAREQVQCPVTSALGKVLARDVVSGFDVPPRDNSAMDGYAFRYDDAVAAGFVLNVSQRIPAGAAPEVLQPGTAARIFTGAEIPPGADTVAMQEDCSSKIVENGTQITLDSSQVARGDNVRPRGQDIEWGATVLRAGCRLRPQEMGLLYSIGQSEVTVYRPLKVAVLSTGDELVDPPGTLGAGQIFNSNRATLLGLLSAWGVDIVDLGIVRDNPLVIEETLRSAASNADLIVTSGGVSVGEEDHVKPAVDKLGELDFWKIAIKPGKPLAYGNVAGVPFMGLPGNPASTFVTASLFLRPLLFSLQGADNVKPAASFEKSAFSKPAVKRQEFIRARRGFNGVEIYPNQSSGMLSSACWGDGVVVQPIGESIQAGDVVKFFAYTEFQ